jgi:hypothetical protein
LVTDRHQLDRAKRPHPQNPPRTVNLRCLGSCGGKMFLSWDRVRNRLCPNCSRHVDGLQVAGFTGQIRFGKR